MACTAAPPLSSLRLLTPPIRLLSAAMYEVARQRSVKHYGMLEQFVSMVTEAMPQLLTESQRKLLLFGLRAKVTVCDPDCQLDRVPSVSRATGDEEWTSSLESLRRRLIHCPEERQRLLQVVFNDSFDEALQSLLSDLLSRMEQMFPTPDFKQAASWMDGAPGGLDYCLHVAQTRDLRVLLNNRSYTQGKPTTKVSADPEYILLSTMSHPFLTEPTNPEPEQKPANQSEGSVQPVKVEEVCDVTAAAKNEPVTVVTEAEQEVVIGQNDEPEESTNESSADCDIIAVETEKSKDFTNQSVDRVNQSDASGSDVIVNALDNISHNAKRVAHKCPNCGKCFIYRSQVIRHLRTTKFCSYGLSASGSKKQSSDSIGGEEDKARPPEDKTRPQGAHSCFQCGESFSSSADLLSHQPSHQARPVYSCSVCGKHFKHMGSFTSHKLTHLDGEGDEKVCEKERQKEIERERRRERELDRRCTVCEQNFPSQSQLLKHLQTHSVEGETPRYRCRHCELTFTGVTALRIHQRSHSSRAHRCGVCSKTYVSLRGLHSHTETHCTDKRFLCAQCGKRFKTRDGFTGHLRTHSGEKPYSCSYCHKDFTALAGLNVHVRRHTGERPYVCTVCGKGWPSGGDLQKHMRVHTGEKPYVCQECGKAFSISCHLTEHRRIHTGEKPYACPDCGKCLRRKFDLKKHMLSHSGVRPFACSVCSKSYTRNTHLNRHLQTHTHT